LHKGKEKVLETRRKKELAGFYRQSLVKRKKRKKGTFVDQGGEKKEGRSLNREKETIFETSQ